MSIVIITGSAGLIGSEAVQYYIYKGYEVIGIDNDMRAIFFGLEGSVANNLQRLKRRAGKAYTHVDLDIRNKDGIDQLFQKYRSYISLVIHTAAQPSHDGAAKNPRLDFSVNANGTLNLLEATRKYAPEAVFIFTSTNKVYGDRPNELPYVELEKRWELPLKHPYYDGIPEKMSIDHSLHSLFGTSKLAADILVQEYGQYFQLKTASFRCSLLTGTNQSGVPQHEFLNYLIKCAITNTPYTILGHKGKQVRDLIEAWDVVAAFDAYFNSPLLGGKVYNLGGGRYANLSILEAIDLIQEITGEKMNTTYIDQARIGDHKWYISSLSRFKQDYPTWKPKYDVQTIIQLIYDENQHLWKR